MSAPLVSVIVPTRNRGAALRRCLASVRSLRYPRQRLEVVIVNDGGDAPALDIGSADELRVKLVQTAHGGPGAARNAGVQASSGEVLAFIDDDCAADAEWLVRLVERLQQRRDAVVGGCVVNALTDNRYARASQGLITYLYAYYHQRGHGLTPFFTTNNMAMLRDTFEAVGLFDPAFTFASEDRDWCDRCLHTGVPLVYEPAAIVRHSHALTLRRFVQQHVRYGRGARRFHRARRQRGAGRMRVEPVSFYMDMLRAPARAGDPEPLRAAALLALSQAAGAVGWLLEVWRPPRIAAANRAQPAAGRSAR